MIHNLILNLEWEKGWEECEIIKFKEWLGKSSLFPILADFVLKEEALSPLLVSPLKGKQALNKRQKTLLQTLM